MPKLTERKKQEVTQSWNRMAPLLNKFSEDELSELLAYEMANRKRYHIGRRILVRLKSLQAKKAVVMFDKKYGPKK